jgi:hypothetical protein
MNHQELRKQRRAPLVALTQQLGINKPKSPALPQPRTQPIIAQKKTEEPNLAVSNVEFAKTVAAHLAKQQQKMPKELEDLIK